MMMAYMYMGASRFGGRKNACFVKLCERKQLMKNVKCRVNCKVRYVILYAELYAKHRERLRIMYIYNVHTVQIRSAA